MGVGVGVCVCVFVCMITISDERVRVNPICINIYITISDENLVFLAAGKLSGASYIYIYIICLICRYMTKQAICE